MIDVQAGTGPVSEQESLIIRFGMIQLIHLLTGMPEL